MALKNSSPLGGNGKIVEADTTYLGGKEKNKHLGKRDQKNIGVARKQIVHTLVERKGKARSHHVANIGGRTLRPILTAHVSRSNADDATAGGYMGVGRNMRAMKWLTTARSRRRAQLRRGRLFFDP
jgi:hypothetical protein